MKLSCAWLVTAIALAACGRDDGLDIGEERIDPGEPAIEEELIRLTTEVTRARRDESGDSLVRRFNQSKTVACTDAELVVDDLPEALAVGLFARPERYAAKLRFANATQLDDREADVRGLSLKVLDVPGAQSASTDRSGGVQDFTFNNYPALFAGTPQDFLRFVEATATGRLWWFFVRHPASLLIALRARSHPENPLAERYHSTTPYRFGGADTAVKFAVESCAPSSYPPRGDDPDYLRAALGATLATGGACLSLMVQLQTDPDRMPVEDASIVWPEGLSPFRKVAEIRIPAQRIDAASELTECEAMTFNPWNTLAAHRPLGGINRVRQRLYEELGIFRTQENAVRR
jgi:hypothetical protein